MHDRRRRTRAAAGCPDPRARFRVCARTDRDTAARGRRRRRRARFAARDGGLPIAEHADAANEQHYEVPAAFFGLVLGPHRKYSSCFYNDAGDDAASRPKRRRCAQTAAHADLADGQSILELGCGWGSLSLCDGAALSHAAITAVSNSHSQRDYIEGEAATARPRPTCASSRADMNVFDAERAVRPHRLGRNVRAHGQLARAADPRAAGSRRTGASSCTSSPIAPAPIASTAPTSRDWIAQHFFTGGIMPSHDLIRQFPDLFEVEEDWRWSGEHYRRTADALAAEFRRQQRRDRRASCATIYGGDAAVVDAALALFFLATAGLFGYADGERMGRQPLPDEAGLSARRQSNSSKFS